ncbi:unnamed protein product [Dracunculus medinensis]|uniref:Protein FAM32A n=1 Tax=Dracunculus medinensis TaxID=318479 RepID=A0A0N4U8Y9_DRAME|nr:unnamed protein product [Dracunculus medinensis]
MRKEVVVKGALQLKKGGKIFKRKKKDNVDLRNIDLTIHRENNALNTHKTSAELAFEKRQQENQFDRLIKKASVSHREKVEKFNAQMSELTEFNDIPKVSWTK